MIEENQTPQQDASPAVEEQVHATDEVSHDHDSVAFKDLMGLTDHPEIIRLAGICKTITLDGGPISENIKELDTSKEYVSFPSLPFDMTDAILNELPAPAEKDSITRNNWHSALTSSVPSALGGAVFQDRLEEEGSDFTNRVVSNGIPLTAELAKFGPSKDGTLTGDNAVFRMQASLGTGAVVQIPLWHSGFWITLRAPSDNEMLELHRRLAEEKINIGRMSFGAAYSNQTVFFTALVMDFVMDHMVRSSVAEADKVRSLIKTTDIHTLAWGMALSIWPRGFQYVRGIVGDPSEPNKIVTQKINLGRSQIVDRSRLTEQQRMHMANKKAASMSVESILAYQNQHVRGREERIVLREGSDMVEEIALLIDVPSMDQYLDSGERWITQMLIGFDKAIGMGGDDVARRNEYLEDHARATLLRQYGHWVKEIHIGPDKITNFEDVERNLGAMTSSPEIYDAYFEKITDYIKRSAIAIIAVPTYNEKDQTLDTHPYCFPIDPISTFFTLLVQKLKLIRTR